MIDLFVKVWVENPIRWGLAVAVLARCARFADVNVHVIACEDSWELSFRNDVPAQVDCHVLPKDKFWIGSKAFAAGRAESDIYVVLDDDHMPVGKDWVEKGVVALRQHPEYACLSSWSVNGEVPEGSMIPADWEWPAKDEFVWESNCTGTPYFIRKGVLDPQRMPVGPLPSYDTVLSEHIRKSGKIGFLRNVRHNHLGYGLSQVIPGWWLA